MSSGRQRKLGWNPPWQGIAMSDEINEIEKFETRWPKDGDVLFVESAWVYDAQVVCDPSERFYRMPMGYKRAGDILIQKKNEKMGS